MDSLTYSKHRMLLERLYDSGILKEYIIQHGSIEHVVDVPGMGAYQLAFSDGKSLRISYSAIYDTMYGRSSRSKYDDYTGIEAKMMSDKECSNPRYTSATYCGIPITTDDCCTPSEKEKVQRDLCSKYLYEK